MLSAAGAVAPREGDGAQAVTAEITSMTVRELIAALARTEEELRRMRDSVRVCAPDEEHASLRLETLAAQGRIVRELRYRRRLPR